MKGSPIQKNYGIGSPMKKTDYAAMQEKSAKKDARYGKMSASEYKTEVQRQVKSKKETGSYDAMGTEAKARKAAKANTVNTKKETVVNKKVNTTKPKAKAKAKDPLTRLGDRITRKKRMVKAATDQGVSKKEAKKIYKTVKNETKKAKKLDKITATADVKTARAKYGRGSAEVKAAKDKRKKIKKTSIEDYKS